MDAQRLVQEQQRHLARIANDIRGAGADRYRKRDHWAWYAFPTSKPGNADPRNTAVLNTNDARFVLGNAETRTAWIAVLQGLGSAIRAQRSRSVLPSIDHGRVEFFVKEWRDERLFAPAVRDHADFAEALKLFTASWQQPDADCA